MINVETRGIRSTWLYRIRVTNIAMKQKNVKSILRY